MVAVCWPLNWMVPGVRTSWLFFPLWLGYILVVDALVSTRAGNSLWSRSRKNFVLLFCFSAPIWWLFELINLRTANWQYLGRELFSPLEFNLLCTIAFSTVIPAVFETAELIQTFRWTHFSNSGPRVAATPRLFVALFVAGLVMFSSPAVTNDVVFIGVLNGTLEARDRNSGDLLWEFQTEKSKQNANWILTAERKFNVPLLFFDAWREAPLVSADRQFAIGAIFSSPLVANGAVYFGSTDGFLYALD